jgi:hypothetical protein
VQSAAISCVQSSANTSPGTVVSNSFCTSTGVAAPLSQQACGTEVCPTMWKVSGFGSCTVSCNGGVQSQTAVCIETQNGVQTTVADTRCSGTKPPTSQTCNTQVCTDGQYVYGAWSTCSVSCGGGIQTRTQQCVGPTGTVYPDNSRCATQTAQPLSQTCNVQGQTNCTCTIFGAS